MRYTNCKRLKKYLRAADRAAKKAYKRATSEGAYGDAARWICDNFRFVKGQTAGLAKTFSEENGFPAEADGTPRLLSVAREAISDMPCVTAAAFEKALRRAEDGYRLLTKEVYFFADMLRFCLAEKLCGVLTKMISDPDADRFSSSKAYSEALAYCVNGLRTLSSTDTEKICDRVSAVENVLRRDPCGAYALASKDSRRRYREAVAKKSRKSGASERKEAELAVSLASRGQSRRARHVGSYLFKGKSKVFGALYFFFVTAFAVLFTFSFFPLCSYFCILVLPSGYELGRRLADGLGAKLCTPRPLFSLELETLTPKLRTLTVITTLMADADDAVFDSLEDYYLSNKDENAFFGILCDLPESSLPTDALDERTVLHAKGRIDALNLKYGGGFCLVTRTRSYSESETSYMGWERKRGAVVTLCAMLKGERPADAEFTGDARCLENIKYVVTLDSDTLLSCGDVKRLVGYMAHPLNEPVVDRGRGVVTEGYGIMQPRMDTSLFSARKSAFSSIISGGGGLDVYQSARYDSYEELFGEGVFCGKGIFDVEAFFETVTDAFPDGVILSHDVLEGTRLRTALISDMTLYDSVPRNAKAYFARFHRWVRGDVQALRFARRRVPDGRARSVKNPINALSRYKIRDCVRRDLLPACSVLAVAVAAFLPRESSAFLTAGALAYTLVPLLFGLLRFFFSKRVTLISRRFYGDAVIGIYRSVENVFFELCSMFYAAVCAADAAVRGFYRANVSHRKTLEWTTAAQADGSSHTLSASLADGLPSALAGLSVVLVSSSVFTSAAAAMWLIYPLFAYFTAKPTRDRRPVPTRAQCEKLLAWSRDTWDLYARHVTASTGFLPPDNVAVEPSPSVAMRTSPTNVGFYLASVLAAADMGFITPQTMYMCLNNTVSALDRLPKWKGHLYNWYDLHGPSVLGRRYVSTVDSGNFCALAVAVKEGALDYADRVPELTQVAAKLGALAGAADFKALYNADRDLFFLGYDDTTGAYDTICYDLYASEARLASYFAIATGQVPVKHWYALSRRLVSHGTHIGLASWTGTAFEYFMPALLLPVYAGSLESEALGHCVTMQKKKTAHGLWGTSESGYFAFDADMNYAYKAFGVGALALRGDVDEETVVSPYSSFLCALADPRAATANLSALRAAGLYGRYGFYEAADMTRSRVAGGIGIVKSYMAHHVGMSLCACDDLLFSDVMKKRFMRDARMRSARLLLCERIPQDAVVEKNVSAPRRRRDARRALSDTVETFVCGDALPKSFTVGNGSARIVADTRGGILMSVGAADVNLAEFSLREAPAGVRFIIYKDGKGETLSFDGCTVESSGGLIKYDFPDGARLAVTVSPDTSLFIFSLSVSADADAAAIVFEPLLQSKAEYLSHPAYSGLFCEGAFDAGRGVLTVSRKNRGKGSGSEYVSVCATGGVLGFCTKKQNALPQFYTERDFCKIEPDGSVGAAIMPFVYLKTGVAESPDGERSASFCVSFSHDAEKAKYEAEMGAAALSDGGISVYAEKLSRAFVDAYAISGLSSADKALSQKILRAVTGDDALPAEPKRQLWRFGISGDLPIAVMTVRAGDAQKVRALLRVYRFYLLRHIRFNPVFICVEDDRYRRRTREEVLFEIERLGCLSLVGARCGIFVADASDGVTPILSRAVCDADEPFCEGAPHVADAVTAGGKTCAKIAVPALFSVYGGEFHERAFTVKKGVRHAPWCHVSASRCFGAIMTENAVGYTYAFNSQMGKLTSPDVDLWRGRGGERFLYTENGVTFDLAAAAERVVFDERGATYFGSVCGRSYELSVGTAEKDFIKSVKLTSEGLFGTLTFYARLSRTLHARLREEREPFCEFESGDGFLRGFTVFLRFDGASSAVSGGSATFTKNVSGAVNETVYLGVFRTEEQRKRYALITDGRTFSCGVGKYLPDKSASVRSGNAAIDVFANFWLPYQTVASRLFARSGYFQCSGAYGFRDQLQDAANLADAAPSLLLSHIYRCAAHQFPEGDVLHWWHRTPEGTLGVRTRCSDDRLWLVHAACEYHAATGDLSFLDAPVPYIDGEKLHDGERERCMYAARSAVRAPLFDHLFSAFSRSAEAGAHGLPLIGTCDWNDSFDDVGAEGRGESVWLAFFAAYLAAKFVPLCEKLGRYAEAVAVSRMAKGFTRAAAKNAYEYGQYLRAFYDDGDVLGSRLSSECRTDVLTQSFAVLAGAEEGERLESILDRIELLWDPASETFPLLSPPFSHDGAHYTGYVRDYPKGVRENGGQYTHAAMWAVMALYAGGRRELAKKILSRICPAERCRDAADGERYAAEPYVAAGDVITAEGSEGRGGWSWYTGAAGWMRTAIKLVFSP